MKVLTGFFMAWGSFCVIPCPVKRWDEDARKAMLVMFPVIGLLIGLLWYGLLWLLDFLAVPILLKAALMTVYPFLISGGIHLDGFMDCNDAILSRRPLEEKQRILKDSHVGAFAVISFVLMVLVYFSAMWTVLNEMNLYKGWTLILIPGIMRMLAADDVLRHKPMSQSQYNRTYIEKRFNAYRGFLGVLGIILVIAPFALFPFYEMQETYQTSLKFLSYSVVLLVGVAVETWVGWYARKQLGGMSGDIAGYSLVWGELAAVIALAVI